MKKYILGATAGDIIGSFYEWKNVKTTDFHLFTYLSNFTDDSVLTFATMNAINEGTPYEKNYYDFGCKYFNRGFGPYFKDWLLKGDMKPYNSWGNGSAMRVSPIGWAFNTLEEVLDQAKKSAEVTHNHPEGIKGAQAIAAAIFLARTGKSKDEIKNYIETTFEYDLHRTLDEIRPTYKFEVSCQKSVPEAIIAFLESTDFENAIRLAVSLGGDSDTIACITGGIAEAFYGDIPDDIKNVVLKILPMEIIELISKFTAKIIL
jgi:ADP-ribosyl-[dinitrogen reductase] hydrolase